MSEEQAEYDALYDQGFDENVTEVEPVEEEVEESNGLDLEQPEEEVETDTTPELDEVEEDTDDTPTEDSKEEPYLVAEYKGQTIELSKEDAKVLAQKGFDYTSKTQDLASKREILEIIDGLSKEDLKALVDAKNGNADALGYVANKANVDIYDVNTDSQYKPEVVNKNYALEDTIKAIKDDTEYGGVINSWVDSLPQSTVNMFSQDPQILADIHMEAKNGIAQKVMPKVLTAMAVNPMVDFKTAYLKARETVVNQPPREEASREIKKKATLSKKQPSKHMSQHKDVWEDDELYAKMKKMVARY